MFDKAFAKVVAAEGGYSDDPRDRGGKTMFGITESVARAHGYQGEIKFLPIDTAKAIYRKSYWDACQCDKLPWPLSLAVFDCAVNQGPGVAVKLMQQALGTVADGYIGPVTIALAARSNSWHAARMLTLRAQRYMQTDGYDRYGAGWLTRLFSIALFSGAVK